MPGSNGNSIMPSFDGAPSGGSSPITGIQPSGTYGGASVSSNPGSAPTGLIGFISNLINVMSTERTNTRNRLWNERQNDLAWERQQQLIREQREYDSPSAQMERLMEAGLNPNLIYGQLSGGQPAATAPNAAGTYQGVAPQVDPSAMLIESQIQANRAKAGLDTSQSERIHSLTPHEVDNLIKDTWLKGYSGNKILAEIDYMKSLQSQADMYSEVLRMTFNNLSYDNAQKKLDWVIRSGFTDYEVENYAARLDIQAEEYKYLSTYYMLSLAGMSAQAQMMLSQANLNSANAKQIADLLPTMQSFYQSQGDKAEVESLIMHKDLENYGLNKFLQVLETLAYSFGQIGGALTKVSPLLHQPKPIGYR